MESITSVGNPQRIDPGPSLRYAVEWRPYLWLRPLKYALGDTAQFAGKRVLDIGCRFGRMACWFAVRGAFVEGLDISSEAVAIARAERSKWGIAESSLSFDTFDGNLSALPKHQYDFVFTKSVLVIMSQPREALAAIPALLRPGGQYLAVENASTGFPFSLLRRQMHRSWRLPEEFRGIDAASIADFRRLFRNVTYKKFWNLVYAIRATTD
jgi:SAM-dependent methyltransferase